ncbi:hypothetical protein WAB17_05355 [Parerythrobacter aurantius]|uniref:hypothetical protein n=1 Tax=Parerythrobacter aurantius TaxID=3127706 RepID=UPI0032476014
MPETLPPVRHPARFVPLTAIATGNIGEPAESVGPSHPLPVAERAYTDARPLFPDSPVAPGRGLLVDCDSAGSATFILGSGSSLSLTLSPGLTLLPLAVVSLQAEQTSALVTAWVLD